MRTHSLTRTFVFSWSFVFFFLIPLNLTGCAARQIQEHWGQEQQPAGGDVIYVADGAGDFEAASKDLRKVLTEDGFPLEVVAFRWSHGYARIIADQTDYAYAREQGRRLAEMVLDYYQRCPHARIFLLGHSAGATVVMSAQEHLPPRVVERTMLLSPSLSSYYDVRPALARVRCAIDNFYSTKDWVWLGVANRLTLTADRRFTIASGRYGFQPLSTHASDACLYQKLHQVPWEPADRGLHHGGGHFDFHHPDYLRAKVVPLFH